MYSYKMQDQDVDKKGAVRNTVSENETSQIDRDKEFQTFSFVFVTVL